MSTSGAPGPTARSRRDRRDALVDGRRDEHRNGRRSTRTIGELDVVANRLPVAWTDGVGWERAPGGLVTALEAVVRRHRLRWFGAATAADGDHRPAWSHGPLVGVRVDPWITDAAVTGMANSTLWPALHGIGERIRWRDSWWDGYVDYNRAFADEIVATAARAASIWVHDYQLLLVPAMLAAQRPDLVVGLSIHTPVDEALGRLPAGDAITDALSAAAVIGVQTDRDRRTLRDLLPERGVSTASSRVPALPEVITSPVSIDPDAALALLRDPATDAIAQRVRGRLEGRYLIVGIDRVDYTKAVEERLRGIDLAFRRGHLDPDRVDIVQVAQPTRHAVGGYAAHRVEVERLAHEVASQWTRRDGSAPLRLVPEGVDRRTVAALLSEADLALVTPRRDGMNLVSKEFSIYNERHGGVLVLSEQAGAAWELGEHSVLVDGSSPASIADGIAEAMHLDHDRRREMARGRAGAVRRWTVHDWAASFLRSLAAA